MQSHSLSFPADRYVEFASRRVGDAVIDRPQNQVLADLKATSMESFSPARPPPIRTVLVPLDGSAASEHALPFASSIARKAGAQVVLVHVYASPYTPRDPKQLFIREPAFSIGSVGENVNRLAKLVREVSGMPVRTVLQHGRWVDDAIVRTAEQEEADLVVMATGMRTWWDRVLRASVTADFVRKSNCPVLLVRGRETRPDHNWEPPVDRILIPLDRSARSEGILEPAMGIGSIFGATYDLMHVARPIHVDPSGWSAAYGGSTERVEAAKYLRSVAQRLKAKDQRARWDVTTDVRTVAEAIVRYADRSRADMIALATRGRRLIPRLILGSVAERVARKASVPVLLGRV